MLEHVQRRRIALPETGVEIALLDFGGDGPTVLLHHANGFCGAMWEPVARELAGALHVVAMDARGHGDSSRPADPDAYAWPRFVDDLEGVAAEQVARAGAPLALGVGHSFGGTAMLAAAARRPGLFARLVLVDPVIHPPVTPEIAPLHRERVGRMVEGARKRRAVFASREAARSSWAERDFFQSWRPRSLELYAAEGLRDRPDGRVELKCAPEVEAAVFERGRGMDVSGVVDGMATPTLFVWARRGNFDRGMYEALAARMQRARVLDVDAGHLAPFEEPELVAEIVRRFACEAPAPGSSSSQPPGTSRRPGPGAGR